MGYLYSVTLPLYIIHVWLSDKRFLVIILHVTKMYASILDCILNVRCMVIFCYMAILYLHIKMAVFINYVYTFYMYLTYLPILDKRFLAKFEPCVTWLNSI